MEQIVWVSHMIDLRRRKIAGIFGYYSSNNNNNRKRQSLASSNIYTMIVQTAGCGKYVFCVYLGSLETDFRMGCYGFLIEINKCLQHESTTESLRTAWVGVKNIYLYYLYFQHWSQTNRRWLQNWHEYFFTTSKHVFLFSFHVMYMT